MKGAPDFAVSCHILPVVQGILLRHCQQLSVHDFFSVLGGWKVFLSLCDGIPLLLGGSSCHCCLGVRDLEISTWKPLVSASLATLEMTIHTCLQVECHCCPTVPHPTPHHLPLAFQTCARAAERDCHPTPPPHPTLVHFYHCFPGVCNLCEL